jgi:hypothetical protein
MIALPSEDSRRRIMELANARGLRRNGTLLRVAGASLRYARVYIDDSQAAGGLLLGEYDWLVIEAAAFGNGNLR